MPKTLRRLAGVKGQTPSHKPTPGIFARKNSSYHYGLIRHVPAPRSKPSRAKPAMIVVNAPDPSAKSIEGKGAGWQETTLGAMLSLPDWDMRIIDLRLGLIRAIRQVRSDAGLTQSELAKRLGISQPRVALLESVDKEPTLDALLPAYFAAGGTVDQLCSILKRTDESMTY